MIKQCPVFKNQGRPVKDIFGSLVSCSCGWQHIPPSTVARVQSAPPPVAHAEASPTLAEALAIVDETLGMVECIINEDGSFLRLSFSLSVF
jgi:hypothetical protein